MYSSSALLLILLLTITASIATASTYQAAVVLRKAYGADSTAVTLQANLQQYNNYVKAAANLGAQILVFPEFALGGNMTNRQSLLPIVEIIPDPMQQTVIPCISSEFNDRPILSNLSCAARLFNIYLVVNMYALEPCQGEYATNCPADGHWILNAEVVFDTNGAIVARYYKQHPWFTAIFNPPPSLQVISFTTSFNVTFGVFTCYDILFSDPSSELLAKGLRHFVYSVAVDIPLIETSMVSLWSWTHSSTILVSNDSTDRGGIFAHGSNLTNQTIPFGTDGNLLLAHVTV